MGSLLSSKSSEKRNETGQLSMALSISQKSLEEREVVEDLIEEQIS